MVPSRGGVCFGKKWNEVERRTPRGVRGTEKQRKMNVLSETQKKRGYETY